MKSTNKTCSNCEHYGHSLMNPEKKVCLAHFYVKGGTKYQDEKGVLPHFKCNCGKFKMKEDKQC